MNKMQHQYIQNLQKSNMTLKCKIKEISEIQTQQDLERATELSDVEPVESDEDFQLQELGTIEEIHRSRRPAQRRNGKDRGFYDKNSIGRKSSKYRPNEEPELKYRPKEKSQIRDAKDTKDSKDEKKDTKKNSKKYQEDEHYRKYDNYYPYYYHEDYYREWYYGEEAYYGYDGYQSQYLNRYERMSRYGPYDEEAAYPHDYFEKHWKTKKPAGDDLKANGHHVRGKKDPHGHKDAEERGFRKYYIYKEGRVQENYARMQQQSNTPLVWKPKESQASYDHPETKPKRGRSKKENRDFCPATFIKDLHKRSHKIEEEKALHRKKQTKAPEKSVLTDKLV